MTCIAGIVEGETGKVYMGGDSAGVADWDLAIRRDPKVFAVGSYVIGFTSSFRMGQLLQHAAKLPEPPRRGASHKFMCTRFVDAVRECMKAGGYLKKENEQESLGAFLVGVAGRLYRFESDLQVGETCARYDAVGCGAAAALGSLFSTVGQPPGKRIHIALSAAERLSAGVRRPFRIVKTKG